MANKNTLRARRALKDAGEAFYKERKSTKPSTGNPTRQGIRYGKRRK